MTKQINYQEIIQQGIPIIQEWSTNQSDQLKETENFKELQKVINSIQQENDFSQNAFEDIRFVLRPFQDELSLKIKRMFNISTLDNYTVFISSRHFTTIEDFINLELSTSKYNGNMTKFFYNPIQLNETIRNFFPYLQTLYLYSKEDNTFENDSRIIAREICKKKEYDLFQYQFEQFEKWTSMQCGEVLFDSYKHKWSVNNSEFNKKIIGKEKLIFLIENNENEKFGYYLHTKIEEKYDEWNQTDMNSFEFNLESNGRLQGPMKFDVIIPYFGYWLMKDSENSLIRLSDIDLFKENRKQCCCNQTQFAFNYQGIEKALCGKVNWNNPVTIKRILVIQMK